MAPGQYDEVAGLIVDKPLTILGSGSDVTNLVLAGSVVSFPIEIQDSPANQSTRIVGLGVTFTDGPLNWWAGATYSIEISQCAGPVLLKDVQRFGPTNERLTVRAEDCAQVVIDDCIFEGRAFYSDCGTPPPYVQPAVMAQDSTVFVHASNLSGGPAWDTCFFSPGVPGLFLQGSSTGFVSDSWLEGSIGISSLSGLSDGHPGVELNFFGNNELTLVGSTTVKGGDGPFGGPAIELMDSQPVTTTPGVAFQAGFDWDGGVTAPAVVESGGQLTGLPEGWTTLTPSACLLQPGDPFTLDVRGEPGAAVQAFLGLEVAAVPFPGVLGSVLLDLGTAYVLGFATLDPQGDASLPFNVPATPALAGTHFALQAVGVSPTLTVTLSNPTSLSVLP